MATFMDVGLLQHISIIFPVLLVFAATYALLMKLKFFGEDKGLNAIIALSIAAMMLFSTNALRLLFFVSPWFVIVMLFSLFVIVALQFMGTEESDIKKVMSVWQTPHYAIMIIAIIILLGGLSEIYGPQLAGDVAVEGEPVEITTAEPGEGAGAYESRVKDIFFHPKVIGAVLLLLIMALAIRTLVV